MKAFVAAAMSVFVFVAAVVAIGLSSGAIAAPGDTVRVSVLSTGLQGDADSTINDMSPDGRFVTFLSKSTNFGASSSSPDIFLRDRDTDSDGIYDEAGAVSTEVVSLPETGTVGSGSASSVNVDGRYVAFSSSDAMVSGDTNNLGDIFVRDRVGGTTKLISVSTAGVQANGHSGSPSISNDGRFVAFCTQATNFVSPSDANGVDDAYLRDRDTDADGIYDEPTDVATIRISEAFGGGDSNGNNCTLGDVKISGDGQFVAFTSHATNLAAQVDANPNKDTFVWNRLTSANEIVSLATGGAQSLSFSESISISDDGRFVTFRTPFGTLVPGDTNLWIDVFLRDRTLGTTERVSVGTGGVEANALSDQSSVSNDGRYVAFQSSASNLIANDNNGREDIFLRDLQLGTTSGVTVNGSGSATCNGTSTDPVISAAGTYVAFNSDAPNLVPADTNGDIDAFVRESGPPNADACPTRQSNFVPTSSIKLCNALPSSGFGDGSVSGNPSCSDTANDGVTLTNTLPGGHLYYSSVVTYVPNGGTPAAGSAGTLAGGVRNAAKFGSLNSLCTISIDQDFVLYNVALPDNAGDPRSSANIVYPLGAGTPDRYGKWKVGSPPTGADPSGINTGGDPDYAVGTSLAFNNYPSYLLDTFDADGIGGAPPLVPSAVYGALTNFGGQWRPLFLVKLPASSSPFYSPAFPAGSVANPAMGSPLVWVLGDPTDGSPTPDAITDVCSPATTTITLTGSASLPTGTSFYLEYLSSGRDFDQDSIENALDTCPKLWNEDAGNPRSDIGDTDGDGIDDPCDNGSSSASDGDGDGFDNRGDNCPNVSNPSQLESEQSSAPPADHGPVVDNFGDACESDGTSGVTQNCNLGAYGGVGDYAACYVSTVVITSSNTVANGRYSTVTNVIAKCVGGVDADGDGYCAPQDSMSDSGACETTAPPSCASRHNAWTSAQPMMQMDTDGDKQSDSLETYTGTDPVQSCSGNGTANNEPMDNWMFDLNDTRVINGQDIGLYASYPLGAGGAFVVQGPFGTPARPGVRYDFNADGAINGQDYGKFGGPGAYGGSGPSGKSCTTAGIPAFHQQ